MHLGKAIKTIREKKKLTQADACKKIGITQPQLSYAENRKDIGVDMLGKICAGYEVPPSIVVFMASDKSDVAPRKKGIYKELAPLMQNIIDEYILNK